VLDPDRSKYKAKLLEQLTPLSDVQKDRMTPLEIEQHEQTRGQLVHMEKEILESIENYDPYQHHFEVLDTDYDNFLMLYTCQQFDERINGDGQTADQVEHKKRQYGDRKTFYKGAGRTINGYLNTMGGNK